jgi:Rrf2 family transcriptional regulator, iron-sulfur cluster assembly transcription factor
VRLTREADYAVLALFYLGARPEGKVTGRPEIAEQLGISNTFLAKVLRKLARAGIVRSYPGMRGGYALAMASNQIRLSEILEAIDGPVTLVRCIDREDGAGSHRPFCGCLALEGLSRVQSEVTRLLEGVTLADLMPNAAHPLHAGLPALASGDASLRMLN